MKKRLILILFCLIPLVANEQIYASTPSVAERYCFDNPNSRFDCQQLECERRNSNKGFNGIFGVTRNPTPIQYEDCEKYTSGVTIPHSLRSGFIAEIVFELLSRIPQLEIIVPITFLGFLSTFFTSTIFSVVGFLFYSQFSFPIIICLIIFCFASATYLFWKKQKK